MESKRKGAGDMTKITLTNVYETKDKMNREKVKKILIQYIQKQTA